MDAVKNSSGKKYDVAIIGGGLGGLECGYILAKHGLNVCILEKNPILGGCLQSFYRKTGFSSVNEFDTGLHYVGGLDDAQPLNTLFKYFNLLKLPWEKLDPNGFDQVTIDGNSYMFANGYNNFLERMCSYFPDQKEGLKKYVSLLKSVGESISDNFNGKRKDGLSNQSLFAQSAYDYLHQIISNPLLIEVLSGTSLKMELSRNLPLYTFAQINSSFIQSAYRLNGGGNLISKSLAEDIQKMGGTIFTNAAVTLIKEKELTINNEDTIYAEKIISDIHPSYTTSLIDSSCGIRKIYRSRMANLKNTFGMFTANISLKPNSIKHYNCNRYIYTNVAQRSLWERDIYRPDSKVESLLINYYNNNNTIDLICPMFWEEVENFASSKLGKRPEEYHKLKEKKLQECLNLASYLIPDIKESIDACYTSTPLTYSNYTNTACGSAYGIKKDSTNLLNTLLTPKTPLSNLFLTGQNLNLHGVLGVTMTSFFTCAEIIGMESATKNLDF